ncbi:thermonuclease family protein [Hydrogenophaga sp. 5NK40-0174]
MLTGSLLCASWLTGCVPENTGGAPQTAAFHGGYDARVVKVVDGDTVWVRPDAGGTRRKLRIVGMDAPEICQDGGMQSRDVLARRILNRTVVVDEGRKDRYGRPLVRLFLGDEDVAAWLVSSGYAWSYRYQGDEGPYALEESMAREAGLGIFANADAMEPRQFRKTHGPCR